jgi:hypothetical protein
MHGNCWRANCLPVRLHTTTTATTARYWKNTRRACSAFARNGLANGIALFLIESRTTQPAAALLSHHQQLVAR